MSDELIERLLEVMTREQWVMFLKLVGEVRQCQFGEVALEIKKGQVRGVLPRPHYRFEMGRAVARDGQWEVDHE